MKKIRKIIVQNKSEEDWRSFAIVEDSEGDMWELRGYGGSVDQARESVVKVYEDKEEYWDISGYKI